jgi:hypothetical protein
MSQNKKPELQDPEKDAARGAAIYTPGALALYDLFVLRFSNSFVWECPSRRILDFYNQHVSDKHLDIGVGTGHFLDRCRFPSAMPAIALFDFNANSLNTAAKRLRRYAPSCHVGNVLQPIKIGLSGFGSIGLNYLLHCLPGDLTSKRVVFGNLRPLLEDGGVLFGSTIVNRGANHNLLARKLMRVYNARGIFSNLHDSQQDLETGLQAHFSQYAVRIEGSVAFFSARK